MTVPDDSTVLCRITNDLPDNTEIVAMLNRDTDLDLEGGRASCPPAKTPVTPVTRAEPADQTTELPQYAVHCETKVRYDDRGSRSEATENTLKYTEAPPTELERIPARGVADVPESPYCKCLLQKSTTI